MTAAFPWTSEIEARLCEEIAGGASVREVSAMPWAPSEPTIYRRMASDSAFAAKVATARAAQQDAEVDKCIQMADEATPADWQVVKLRIWARQWRASKLAPKKYGDSIKIEGKLDVSVAERLARARQRTSNDEGNDLAG